MTILNLSDAQLEARLIDKTQKLLITKAVSGDFRLGIEKAFSDDTNAILRRVMIKLSQTLRDEGYLELFSKQARLINMSFTRQRDRRRELNNVIRSHLMDLVGFVYDLSERRAFQRIHRLHTRMAYEYGAITALRSMGFGARSERLENYERNLVKKAAFAPEDVIEFGLSDEEVLFWLESGTAAGAETFTTAALTNARLIISENLVLGGMGIDETATLIGSSLDLKDYQALRIARTETQVAFNSAMNDQYVRSKVTKRQWLTVGDRRVRPAHVMNEAAGLIEYPKPFPNGAMHPGEGPDSINCRCSIQADLSDPEILIEPWDGQATIMEPEIPRPPKLPRRDKTPTPKPPTPKPKPKPKPTEPSRVGAPEELPSIGGRMGATADEINDELHTLQNYLESPWGRDAAFKKKVKKRMANLRAKKKRITGVRPVTADVDVDVPDWMGKDYKHDTTARMNGFNDKELKEITTKHFGSPKTRDEIASIVGAPDGSTITLTREGSDIFVRIKHPDIHKMSRYIRTDADGKLFIYNDYFMLNPDIKQVGRGLEIFNKQLRASVANDVQYFKCFGAGSKSRIDEWSGYYVWPRYGYQAPLQADDAAALLKYGDNVSDVMKTPKGQADWKELGNGRDFKFHLNDGSYSRETFDKYLAARKPELLPKGHPLHPDFKPKPPPRAPKPDGLTRGFPHAPEELEFVKDLGGSTGAKLMRDPRTGKQYVLKKGANADHLRSEYLAEQLYREAGAKVPKSFLYDVDGIPVKLSEFVEDALDLRTLKATDPIRYKKAVAKIEKDFASDAVLGNWDTVGMSMDNILVSADDVVWRVDVGGSLRYRAQGDLKDAFSTNVTELWSLSKEGNNAAQVFGNMTWNRKVKSMEKLVKTRAKVLAKIDDPELRKIVAARFDDVEDTLFHHRKFKEAGWTDDHSGLVMQHRVQMREAGVFDDMPTQMFSPETGAPNAITGTEGSLGNNWATMDMKMRLANDRNWDFFQDILPSRIKKYMLENGGSPNMWNAFTAEQAGNSWNQLPIINKHWLKTRRTDGKGSWYWQRKDSQWKRKLKAQENLHGGTWADTMAIEHAANYDMLTSVKMMNNDNAAGVVRIIRTERSDTMKTYFDDLYGGLRQMDRGFAESGSIFKDFYHLGDLITIQEVEHANVLGSFIIRKKVFGSVDDTFAGIGENEFLCVFKPDGNFIVRPHRNLPEDFSSGSVLDSWSAGNLLDDVFVSDPMGL
jgi:hypothetical protein